MWSELSHQLLLSATFQRIEKPLKGGESLLLEGLWDVPKALIAAFAVQATGKSVLLITGGMREDKFFDDLQQLAPDCPVEFPAWETLPGEEIPPSPDIIGKRFEALHRLIAKKTPSILLCPLPSLLQKILPKEVVSSMVHIWKKGTSILFSSLPEILTALGYVRSAVVSDKGQFALRGGILDLFPTASQDPYRIEFFGDEIDQIRIFDPVGQKSIEKVDSLFLCPADELGLVKPTVPASSWPANRL